ncbi:hypothetical protein UA08_04104 [Talaromyces atroroseus]|uniref:Uncharacterized protein n=1 Tax=Talaromyces atroroseus TaxID=1441469 RepID=A0A1Q5Q9F1_TALAT|nr:hypothetical protein UA08_04104 [Talaromyces atroroseus]OKL60580.1 hypothetical protein UA08_04104 [Talaromyces atroroseus]
MASTTKRGFLRREGLYIDPIIAGLRGTILHPLVSLTVLFLVHGRGSLSAAHERLIQFTAVSSTLLWLNDWLNAKSRNNWVQDDTWGWKKEVVVVTGGSSGIGAGVVQRLAALGTGVVVLDIAPLTYKIAPFLLTRESLPFMIQQNHGHIFNVASVSAYIPPPGLADYAASKSGLIAFHEEMFKLLSFTKTPLFKGETNQSHFLTPLLHVDTVVDAIVETLDSGLSQTIFLPGIFAYCAGSRGAPDWFQNINRNGTKSLKVDFRGRQKIDPRTGKLV